MAEKIREIELQEYQDSNPIALDGTERDHIKEALKTAMIQPVSGKDNEYTINPRNNVGIIRIDDLVLNIKPKIPFERVIFLVAYSLKMEYWRDPLVDLSNAKTLHEAIAIPFAHFAEKATRRHILHSYRSYDDTIAGVKGRIRLEDQLRKNMGLSTPVEVSYDELTSDTDENRILLAAAERLLHLRRLDPDTTQMLRRIVQRLPEVQKVRYRKNDVPVIPITRLNKRYEKPLALARLILGDETLELGPSNTSSSGMLFDMAKVFENFVHVALMEALKLNDKEFPPNAQRKSLYLDSSHTLKLKPDLSWWEHNECKVVGDIKYKKNLGDDRKGKEPDIYQLLAYTTATNLNEGFLIYADTEENPEPASHKIRYAGKTLHIETLNLSGEDHQILNRIQVLAEKIKRAKSNDGKLQLAS
jgi:5-methylcytosine-specific restriction enzyme subunit McrC